MKIRVSWVGQYAGMCQMISLLYFFLHICKFDICQMQISQIQIRKNENKSRAICWDVSAARGNKSKSANAGNYFFFSFSEGSR